VKYVSLTAPLVVVRLLFTNNREITSAAPAGVANAPSSNVATAAGVEYRLAASVCARYVDCAAVVVR
jgi:hypothetical protein